MYIRKNDTVVLLKDITSCKNAEGTPIARKGERTKVLSANPKRGKLYLQGCNYRWRHVRPSQTSPRGGRIQKEAAVDASNVALYCDKCHKGVRVRFERRDGQRVRMCVKCQNVIPAVL
jgi:large subunit ribosomal protein L24